MPVYDAGKERVRTALEKQFLDPNEVGILYEMLDVMDKIFHKYDVHYWIDGGTLLSGVRQKGMMPWDNDADIKVYDEDWQRAHDKILGMREELAKHDIKLRRAFIDDRKHLGIGKVHEPDPPEVAKDRFMKYERFHKDPHFTFSIFRFWSMKRTRHFVYIDIMITKMTDKKRERLDLSHSTDNARYPGSHWFWPEVSTVKRYPYGPIFLDGPNEPIRYLKTYYGNDSLEVAYYKKQKSRLAFPIQCFFSLDRESPIYQQAKDHPYNMLKCQRI